MPSLYGFGALASGLDQGLNEAAQRRQMQQEMALRQLQMRAQQRQLQRQQWEDQAIGAGIVLPPVAPAGQPGAPGMPGPGPGPAGSLAGFPGSQPGGAPGVTPPIGAPQMGPPQMGGAAPAPMPAGAPPPAPPPQADNGAFDTIYDGWLAPKEGGLNPNDAGAGVTNFGINQRANPGVDVRKLTPQQAKGIIQAKYWRTSGAGQLPPELAAIQLDTAVNMGPGVANQMLRASGGDPAAYLKLRETAYRRIAASNPAKAASLRPWLKRNAELAEYSASLKGGGQVSAAGGPQAAPPAAGGPAEGNDRLMDMWAKMQEQTSPEAMSRTLGQITSALKSKFPDASDEELGVMTQAYLGEMTKFAGLQRQPDMATGLMIREMEQDRRFEEGQAGQDRREQDREQHQDTRANNSQQGQDRRQKERLTAQQHILDERLAQSERQFEQRERDIDARLARRQGNAAANAKTRMAVSRIKTARQAIIDQMNAYKAKNAGAIAPNDGNWAQMQQSLDQTDHALMDIEANLAGEQTAAAPAAPAGKPKARVLGVVG